MFAQDAFIAPGAAAAWRRWAGCRCGSVPCRHRCRRDDEVGRGRFLRRVGQVVGLMNVPVRAAEGVAQRTWQIRHRCRHSLRMRRDAPPGLLGRESGQKEGPDQLAHRQNVHDCYAKAMAEAKSATVQQFANLAAISVVGMEKANFLMNSPSGPSRISRPNGRRHNGGSPPGSRTLA